MSVRCLDCISSSDLRISVTSARNESRSRTRASKRSLDCASRAGGSVLLLACCWLTSLVVAADSPSDSSSRLSLSFALSPVSWVLADFPLIESVGVPCGFQDFQRYSSPYVQRNHLHSTPAPRHQIVLPCSLLVVHFPCSGLRFPPLLSPQPCSSCSSSISRLFRPWVNDIARSGNARNIRSILYLQAFCLPFPFCFLLLLSFSLSVGKYAGTEFGLGEGSWADDGYEILPPVNNITSVAGWLPVRVLHHLSCGKEQRPDSFNLYYNSICCNVLMFSLYNNSRSLRLMVAASMFKI